MENIDWKYLDMKGDEAFIRRASQINLPFMLKGSYVTRQYFQNPNDRIPDDIDWVYLGEIKDVETASQIFNEWAVQVTEFELEDDVKFKSFKKNSFWRRIDYAMADDFPTVNTDMECEIEGLKFEISLDISFNLEVEQAPVPLLYQPLEGEAFLIPNTVPISLQVAWKIHQTLVRPRFKDLFDLMHLVQHPSFDEKSKKDALQALVNECHADNVDLLRLKYFLSYQIEKLFPNNSIDAVWAYWRHDLNLNSYPQGFQYESAKFITDATKLPEELADFIGLFKMHLENVGFGIELFENLPRPKKNQKQWWHFKTWRTGKNQ